MVLATQENCDTALTAYDIDIICGVSIYIIKNLAFLLRVNGIFNWEPYMVSNKIAAMQYCLHFLRAEALCQAH